MKLKYEISVLMQRVHSQRNCLSNQHAKPLFSQKVIANRRKTGNTENINICNRNFKGSRRGSEKPIAIVCHSDAVRFLPNGKL